VTRLQAGGYAAKHKLVLKEKVSAGVGRSEDVFPFIAIAQRGVNSGEVAEVQPHRTISKPRFLCITQFPPRKGNSGSRVLIEVEFASGFNASFIVVTHDDGGTQAPNHLEAFSGVRAIADNVAQADHLLDPFERDIRQDSFQSLEIAVDIGENGELHEIAYHELPAMRRDRQSSSAPVGGRREGVDRSPSQ
jgi:hypothetical protein